MMKRYKELCKEFCEICDNSPSEHQAVCKEVNEKFRRKYVIGNSCPHAIIKGVPVSILKRNKVLVELGGEWYARDNLEKIEYALNEKRERLEKKI